MRKISSVYWLTMLVWATVMIKTLAVKAQVINTVAGGGGSGTPAMNAILSDPIRITVDGQGNLYIAEFGGGRIRKVTPAGIITLVAGGGSGGDGGLAVNASLVSPSDVAIDKQGNLFISDQGHNLIRKVSTTGIISTYAGNGNASYGGDFGPATQASFFTNAIALDSQNNLYIVDGTNNRVRKVTPNGFISTFAGNGSESSSGDGGPATNASLNKPIGIAIDPAGNVYIAEGYARVRRVNTAGVISTYAGNGTTGFSGDGGPATSAKLGNLNGVAIDPQGSLYISVELGSRIRKVTPDGVINTVAGNGTAGFGGDGGTAVNAILNAPYGLAVDTQGNLFIADRNNDRVRKITIPNTSPTLVNPIPDQTASVGAPFSYTLSADTFTDAETPNGLSYSATISPANNLSYNAVTRVISGTPSMTGTSTVVVKATDPASVSAATSFTITILPSCQTAVSIVSSSAALCTGQPVSLSAFVQNSTNPVSYTWAAPVSTTLSSVGTPVVQATGLPTGLNTFTVVVTDAANCRATRTISLTVTALPSAVLTANNGGTLTCAQSSLTLTAEGGNMYLFDGPSVLSQNSNEGVAQIDADGLYSVTVTDGNGCSTTATTSISRSVSFAASAISDVASASVGSVVSLTAGGGNAYQWISPGTASIVGSSTESVVSVRLVSPGPQSFSVLISLGACSQTRMIRVTATNGPDLTATMTLPEAIFPPGNSQKQFIVRVQEVGWLPTAPTPIAITVSAPAGYTLSFANALTSINVSGGTDNPVNVDNANWYIRDNLLGQQLTVMLNSGQLIEAGGQRVLGFTLTRVTANSGSTSNITVSIANDQGRMYDINPVNNVYARIISGL